MEQYYLGVDLGTSSVRVFLADFLSGKSFVEGKEYDVIIPRQGFAEQDPEIWYKSAADSIKQLLSKNNIPASSVKAVSFSGQMHGLVALDAAKKPVCNAIIWLDQRSSKYIEEINGLLGKNFIAENIQNRISAGMLLPSLYWIKKERPDIYSKIKYVMLPKDYIKFRLCGEITTDFSDAAGSLAFDNVKGQWSKPVIDKLGIDFNLFPQCLESHSVVGKITSSASKDTGLIKGTPVVNGGADQCMQAIGNGVIYDGLVACNIGTAGQMSTTIKSPIYDKELRTNTFMHAVPSRYNFMGACLNSGISLNWFSKKILGQKDYAAVNHDIALSPPGARGLIFLPYLTGERTPHMNPKARGMFLGLTLENGRGDLQRAVMEGVTFALNDCLNILIDSGIKCDKIISSGGGARSDIWLQIQADIFNKEVYRSSSVEQACLGAAITAAVGTKAFKNFDEACSKIIKKQSEVFVPKKENVKIYAELYNIFREAYKLNFTLFNSINEFVNKSH